MARRIPLNETFKCMCLCPAHNGALRSYAKARTWRLGPPTDPAWTLFQTYLCGYHGACNEKYTV